MYMYKYTYLHTRSSIYNSSSTWNFSFFSRVHRYSISLQLLKKLLVRILFLFFQPVVFLCSGASEIFFLLVLSVAAGFKEGDNSLNLGNRAFCGIGQQVMKSLSFRSVITLGKPLGWYCTSHCMAVCHPGGNKTCFSQDMLLATMDGASYQTAEAVGRSSSKG